MLKCHANLITGNNGHVVWCNEMLKASLAKWTPWASDFVQTGAHRDADNCPRKVVIVNEGAGDCVALLGKSSITFYSVVIPCMHVYILNLLLGTLSGL